MDTLQLIEQVIDLLEQAEEQSGWATPEHFAIQTSHEAAKRARNHIEGSDHIEQDAMHDEPRCSKGLRTDGCALPF